MGVWQVDLGRLSGGEKISSGSAVLLFVFMFFRWYGISLQSNLLGHLQLFEDGGNAWQTLDVTPIFLTLVVAVTVGTVTLRLCRLDWAPPVPSGAPVWWLSCDAGRRGLEEGLIFSGSG
jgi:hypothetical protein